MSERFHLTYTRVIITVFGIVLLLMGGLLSYYAFTVEGTVPTRSFTPLGFLLVIIGIFLLVSKET